MADIVEINNNLGEVEDKFAMIISMDELTKLRDVLGASNVHNSMDLFQTVNNKYNATRQNT